MTLLSAPTGSVYGDPFTVDEKFALYFSDVDTTDFAGTLDAWGTAAGGQKREIAQRVWIAGAVGGSRVLYNDNFTATKNSGYADLKLVDLAGSGAPTLIATRADPDFFTTPSRDKVVFTINQQKGKEGLYAASLP